MYPLDGCRQTVGVHHLHCCEHTVDTDNVLKRQPRSGRGNNPSVEFARQAGRVLGISVAELLGEEVQIKRARKTGPTGKVHKILELNKLDSEPT